ncbi:hypothetical protein [Tropicibacter sp. S64]|uniref:hypothetical protein n=1 Tax=Tropicibacter sp. S64 TaxID=3415122 RepID=UPI003C7A06AB
MTHEQMNDERQAFWAALSEAAPELGIEASPGWEKEIGLSRDGRVRIKMSLSQDKTSVYLVARSDAARDWVLAHLDGLAKELRTTVGTASGEPDKGRWFRKDNAKACVTVRRQWPEAIRWLRAQHATFKSAIAVLEGT